MIITPKEFDYEWFNTLPLAKRGRGNQGNKRKIKYKDIITAFDIETTRLPYVEQSVMYIWQWQFGEECTVIGRTWEEFKSFRDTLTESMQPNEYLVSYVHNLSYEFQFLRGIYEFTSDEVFALKKRKILKCEMSNHLEFRCSYIHSNMSLGEYTHKMGAKHAKLSGDEFDYSIQRYPWTELTSRQLEYCQNDVLGLVEAITIEMEHDGDTLYSIPLTSTGYVRRDTKKAMRFVSHSTVPRILPDKDLYLLLREAFRGGNTHASRFYSNMILSNVHSADRSSSYPDVICNCEYPISKFFHSGKISYAELTDLIGRRGKAVVMRVAIRGLRLKEGQACPYISKDKSRKIIEGTYDNGRILTASYLETSITDIDLRIILIEYDFDDLEPLDVYHARYGKLPQPIIDVNIMYYKDKTELKGVASQEIYYIKQKNKLNSIYGMMAQDPVKQNISFTHNEFIEAEEDIGVLLEESNRRAFLAYQWGVWTTAHARWRLEEGIQLAGENFVYCDTDSVKHLGTIDWDAYNKERIADSIESGAYATDPKGYTHHMGVFEDEGVYHQFITMGAKKYGYRRIPGGKTEVTVSGVNKRMGGVELDLFYDGLESFEPGFIFNLAGGTESVYNDGTYMDIDIDGHTLHITPNVVIRDSTYTLGITGEYKLLLENAQKTFDKIII